jgi:hypothetical protein
VVGKPKLAEDGGCSVEIRRGDSRAVGVGAIDAGRVERVVVGVSGLVDFGEVAGGGHVLAPAEGIKRIGGVRGEVSCRGIAFAVVPVFDKIKVANGDDVPGRLTKPTYKFDLFQPFVADSTSGACGNVYAYDPKVLTVRGKKIDRENMA